MTEFELNKFKIEHIFTYSIDVDAKMFIQKLPTGPTRVTGVITGGKVWGPKINGKILPVGADWSTVHPNGIVDVDCRAMIETEDGADINMFYKGRIDLGSAEAAADYADGKFPAVMGTQPMPVLDTDDPRYDWCNRIACFGIGRVDFTNDPIVIQYDVYRYYATPFAEDGEV